MNEDDYMDELFEQQHRQRLHRRLMNLPVGHPDEGDFLDALEMRGENCE